MFTNNQLQILAIFINNPDKEFYISEIGNILKKKPGVFQRTLNSLEKTGIIMSFKKRNQHFFRINISYPFLSECKSIVQKTTGVEGLIRELVKKIKGIQIVLLYGSYVKNQMRPDSDIDLLVVGTSKAEDILLQKIKNIENTLQREINYVLYSDKEFYERLKNNDPFLEEIISSPYILLKGTI